MRIRERLVIDKDGARHTTEVLPEASLAERIAELAASVPEPGPDGVRMLWISCNGCGAHAIMAVDVGASAALPADFYQVRIPEGWVTNEAGEFCPACQS